MAITLTRPAFDYEPSYVPAHLVTRIDLMHVPTSLREHAHTILADTYGPGEHWFAVGEWYPTPAPRTLCARYTATGEMQYGTPVPPTTH